MQPRYKDYWGYEINMMEELVRRLDFTYEIVNPPDAAWGMINETGQWTGLTGMASRGDADSGASTGIEVIGIIGDFLPNFARFQVGENVLQVLTPNGTTSISVLAFKLLFAKLRITACNKINAFASSAGLSDNYISRQGLFHVCQPSPHCQAQVFLAYKTIWT